MKNIIHFFVLISLSCYFVSCSTDNPVEPKVKGKLFISTIPPGAKILLNGINTGIITPDTIETNAGEQKISLLLNGFADTTFIVNISSGKTQFLNVVLTPLGTLVVISDPLGAQIWLNGNNSGQITPYTFTALSPATYDVTFKLENYRDTTLSVVVSYGSTASLNVTLIPIVMAGKSGPPVGVMGIKEDFFD